MRFISAQAQARARLTGVLAEVCAGSGSDWPAKLAAAVEAGLNFAVEDPEGARLLLLDAIMIDPALGAGALQMHEFLADLLRSGRDHCADAATMPALTERAMIGSATSLVGNALIRGEAADLSTLRAPLTELFLTPYVGPERAHELSSGEDDA